MRVVGKTAPTKIAKPQVGELSLRYGLELGLFTPKLTNKGYAS
jgi:hypothetical protein